LGLPARATVLTPRETITNNDGNHKTKGAHKLARTRARRVLANARRSSSMPSNSIPKIPPRFSSWRRWMSFLESTPRLLSQIDRHVLRLEKSQPLLEQIKAAIQAARTGTLPKSSSGQGLRLHADALEPAQSLPRISGSGIKQQLGRECDEPGRSWPAQLDSRRKSRGWTTSRRNHFNRRNMSPPGPTPARLPRLCAPGAADFPSNRSAELTSSAWAAKI
jgi:hypothetical protein